MTTETELGMYTQADVERMLADWIEQTAAQVERAKFEARLEERTKLAKAFDSAIPRGSRDLVTWFLIGLTTGVVGVLGYLP